jgi:hypothetical protein
MQIASHVLILLVRALRQHADFAARSRPALSTGVLLQSGSCESVCHAIVMRNGG